MVVFSNIICAGFIVMGAPLAISPSLVVTKQLPNLSDYYNVDLSEVHARTAVIKTAGRCEIRIGGFAAQIFETDACAELSNLCQCRS
jgi:hypothetical protein